MCLIIDNDVSSDVFGTNPSVAGTILRDSINNARRKLVLGGKLRTELTEYSLFQQWFSAAYAAGYIQDINDELVDQKTRELNRNRSCRSNDPHVIALAQVSGCRVLCTRDDLLQRDFKSKELINTPRGRVYSLGGSIGTKQRRDTIIKWTNQCRACR